MEDTKINRRRGIFLLPNTITTAALFCGFYAVVAANNNDYKAAVIAIFLAMVFDGLDGRVARMTNTQSDFGVEYDSISDMLCFGVAPSLVAYEWALKEFINYGPVWGKLAWLGAFIYTACSALRLARFNTQVGVIDKKYFQGLASPAAAAVIMSIVLSGEVYQLKQTIPHSIISSFCLFMVVAVGILMVSNVRYYSFKDLDKYKKVSFINIVAIVLVLAGIWLIPVIVLLVLFFGYCLSGPIFTIMEIRKRRMLKKKGEFKDVRVEPDIEAQEDNEIESQPEPEPQVLDVHQTQEAEKEKK
ncbi:MAG: CDP-diacylglycerol--serine O-phosphatidyltransferase [Gammaproteobacteria bacterium]|nr:MAG: CDP-diacylglycerol--serine O-phosphatidyltransferase [Gammaproteobacteria bacterium]